jgi:nitroreductase
MKDNYAAWHINPSEFSDDWTDLQKLQFFGHYAVLSPSGHNTQPWHFSHTDDSLLLKVSPERKLPFSGKIAGEPYVSLGACLETLTLAARGFGYELNVELPFSDVVAVIKLGNKTTADPTLLDAITNRSSNRYFYDPEPIDDATLKDITTADLPDVFVQTITSETDRNFIAEQTTAATLTLFHEPQFREELSKWVRNNLTHKFDGMPGFAQKIPTPPSMIAPLLIKNVDISKDQAKKDTALVQHSPAMAMVAVKEINDQAFLAGGRMFAHICIMATKHGLASTGVGAAIIDPTTRQKVADHFGVKYQPIALVRLGKTSQVAKHTPRWPFEKVSD